MCDGFALFDYTRSRCGKFGGSSRDRTFSAGSPSIIAREPISWWTVVYGEPDGILRLRQFGPFRTCLFDRRPDENIRNPLGKYGWDI